MAVAPIVHSTFNRETNWRIITSEQPRSHRTVRRSPRSRSQRGKGAGRARHSTLPAALGDQGRPAESNRRSENRLGGSQIRGLHLRRGDSRLARQVGFLPLTLIRSGGASRFAASLLSPLNSPKIAWWARIPLSLALNDSRSVLAAKGPLRRFAPWTAPGRSGRPLFTREKGGLLPGSSPGGR